MALHPLIQQAHLPSSSCFPHHHPNLSLQPISRNKVRIKKRLKMSRRNDSGVVELDLKLNLSPPRSHWTESSPTGSSSVSPTNSCVSFGGQDDHETPELRYSSSPETTTSMMLAGCPRCLMYVMLAEDYPMCPQCKTTVLLDVVFDKPIINKSNT